MDYIAQNKKTYNEHYNYFQDLLRDNQMENTPPGKIKNDFFKNSEQYEKLLEITPGVVLIVDFTQHNYLYHSSNISQLDLDIEQMYQHGTAYTFSLFQKDHYEIMRSDLFPEVYKLFSEYSKGDQSSKLRITYCNKMRVASGEYKWFMHHISILSAHENEPVIGLKYMVNIHHFKNDNNVDFVAYENNADGTDTIKVKKTFNPVYTQLSDREKEVIALLARGKTSKQIAYELGISEHTVNNHRRNMLQKTNTVNVTELVNSVI